MAADPRVTGFLDDFQRPDESPLSYGGRWLKLREDNPNCPLRLEDGSVEIHAISGQSTQASYWYQPFSGDVEVWGLAITGHDLREGLQLYLHVTNPFKPPGAHEGDWRGYILTWYDDIMGTGGDLIRRDGEYSITSLGSYAGGVSDAYMLRTRGSTVEYWTAPDPFTDWTLRLAATDNTYRSGYIGLGTRQDDYNPAWIGFGGGRIRRRQIYRYVK